MILSRAYMGGATPPTFGFQLLDLGEKQNRSKMEAHIAREKVSTTVD